jgi:pimeloyl-ACP methyl ester carboxylesterase
VAVIGDRSLPAGLLASVAAPALVITGEQSPPFLRNAARAAAGALPNGQLAILPGQTHDISPQATAPVIAEFLAVTSADSVRPSPVSNPASKDRLNQTPRERPVT